VLAQACRLGGRVEVTEDVIRRHRADGSYDVWISLAEASKASGGGVQPLPASTDGLGFAQPSALVIHGLPPTAGEVITDSVLDGPRSIVLEPVGDTACNARRR